jgi:hypothetical protein
MDIMVLLCQNQHTETSVLISIANFNKIFKRINMKLLSTLSIFILVFLFTSCNDQDYYQTNPNEPSNATPSLILSKLCIDVFNFYPVSPAYASRYLTYYERPTNEVNYGWVAGDFGAYNTLRQVKAMEKLATASNESSYLALGKFFRAVLFSSLTEQFGDVPYSQALQAEEGIVKPIYDSQEDIFVAILKDLDDANTMLSQSNSPINGDIIYGGNLLQWRKAINAFRLRTLIHLSKKEANTRLNIKQQMASVVGDPIQYPLMKDRNDNAQITFNKSSPSNYYPMFNSNSIKSLVSIEEGFANLLIERQDQRLFALADPIKDKQANDFANYKGVNAGLVISDQQNIAQSASKIKRRFVNDSINEPLILIGFSEQEFIIAEAIQRGWINGPGTAASHYNAGIRSSFQFYGLGGSAIESYLGKPLVKYNDAKGLELIAIQKYISMFCQSNWESFYEQRRTGFPTFNVGPATLNSGLVPKRWAYPPSELDYNTDAVKAAVQRQFGGSDDINGEMWILKQ